MKHRVLKDNFGGRKHDIAIGSSSARDHLETFLNFYGINYYFFS